MLVCYFFLMCRRPPRSTRTDPLFPYTTRCRCWGAGRMVREYSLSLSAPDTLALPVPPRIEAPQMAMPDTIERAQEPMAIPLAANALAAGVTAADAVDAP